MARKKTVRPSYHHGDLRNALLQAAGELLAETSPRDLSLRDVARRARVSHMAPYRHFENRNALLAELAVQGFADLRDEMRAAADEHPGDPTLQLQSAGIRYVRLAMRQTPRLMLMFGGVLGQDDYTPEQCRVTEEAFDGLHAIIQRGQADGVFRAGDSRALSLSAWSLVHGLAMLLGTGHLAPMGSTAGERDHLTALVLETFATGILRR